MTWAFSARQPNQARAAICLNNQVVKSEHDVFNFQECCIKEPGFVSILCIHFYICNLYIYIYIHIIHIYKFLFLLDIYIYMNIFF